jgi:hypothetical protein
MTCTRCRPERPSMGRAIVTGKDAGRHGYAPRSTGFAWKGLLPVALMTGALLLLVLRHAHGPAAGGNVVGRRDLAALWMVSGIDDYTNPQKTLVRFKRSLPREAVPRDNQLPAAESWTLLCCANKPGAPALDDQRGYVLAIDTTSLFDETHYE